jgi:hypothetical protein
MPVDSIVPETSHLLLQGACHWRTWAGHRFSVHVYAHHVPGRLALRVRHLFNGKGRTAMGILTTAMRRMVEEQRLGFAATVCPDGTPNLSPKGTTSVWDDDHLIFADIHSPGTVANLRHNPAIEINVVDPLVRKATASRGSAR